MGIITATMRLVSRSPTRWRSKPPRRSRIFAWARYRGQCSPPLRTGTVADRAAASVIRARSGAPTPATASAARRQLERLVNTLGIDPITAQSSSSASFMARSLLHDGERIVAGVAHQRMSASRSSPPPTERRSGGAAANGGRCARARAANLERPSSPARIRRCSAPRPSAPPSTGSPIARG